VVVDLLQLEGHVVHADDLAALGVDDLLVQQVPRHPQAPHVVVVWDQLLVAQVDPVEGNRGDLVVPDCPPGPFAAHQELIDADLVDARRKAGVANAADAPALQVVHAHAHQLREKEQAVGHRTAPPDLGRIVKRGNEPA
jgi:hypothetical protein